LAGRCRAHTLPSSDEDWESNLVLDVFDLFTQRGLGEEQLLSGSREIACLSQRDNVLQMSELHEI
jgi:hypothetical protein